MASELREEIVGCDVSQLAHDYDYFNCNSLYASVNLLGYKAPNLQLSVAVERAVVHFRLKKSAKISSRCSFQVPFLGNLPLVSREAQNFSPCGVPILIVSTILELLGNLDSRE